MTAPAPLQAVADLRRCLQGQDYAGAERLIRLPAALDGLAALAAQAGQARREADEARREAAALRLGEAERARVQAQVGPLLEQVIGVLAEALLERRDAEAAEWPAPRRAA